METICFSCVRPRVFAQVPDLQSDVWDCDLALSKGQFYLVEASSGKGKSTFCSYLLGYRNDFAGRILFDGKDIASLGISEWTDIRQHHISHVFQELRLFPELTAMENVQIKNRLIGFKTERQIGQWFERLGIADKQQERIGQMSFGQQQRVALMRALVQPFDFLLLDEPVSHLDDENARIMGELLQEEARAQGAAVVVTSIGKHMALDYDKKILL